MNYLSDFRCVNKLIPLLSSACLERELQCRLACQCCEIASHQGLLRTAMVTTCGRIGQQQLWPLLRSVFSLFSRLLGVDGVVDTCLPAWLIHFVSTQCFTYEFCYVIVIAVNQVVTVAVVVIIIVRVALLPFLSISVWVKDSDWSIDRNHWERRGVKRAWRRATNVANSWLLFCGIHDVCAMYGLETPMLLLAVLLLLTGLCNLLINHTQRCLPTLTLHLSWRTATFLCVSTAQHESNLRDEQTERRHDNDERISTMRMSRRVRNKTKRRVSI